MNNVNNPAFYQNKAPFLSNTRPSEKASYIKELARALEVSESTLEYDDLILNYKNLTTVPASLGNLSQLRTLELIGNQLTTVPECLFSLPSTCIISIHRNPIPIDELRALQARINTPGYNGPRFYFSL